MDRGRLNTSTLDRVSRLASTAGDAASIQISIDAIQWDISLVDKDVRRLVEVTQSKTKQTYAGTSNETPQGRDFLKKQLDVLMKEKAQYKEKKQALLQLQDNLQGNLPGIQEGTRKYPEKRKTRVVFATYVMQRIWILIIPPLMCLGTLTSTTMRMYPGTFKGRVLLPIDVRSLVVVCVARGGKFDAD